MNRQENEEGNKIIRVTDMRIVQDKYKKENGAADDTANEGQREFGQP